MHRCYTSPLKKEQRAGDLLTTLSWTLSRRLQNSKLLIIIIINGPLTPHLRLQGVCSMAEL
jgi:hypothetical protein